MSKEEKKCSEENGNAEVAAVPVEATPLPRSTTIALSVILLSESVCASMLIPFVGLFVAFLSDISPDEAGYRSGVLIGLFMLGQVLSSKLWGYSSDEYGRRVPLIFSLTSGAITMFCFGLSTRFAICCFMRFVQGFLNGSTLVAKAIISDITDSTNQAKGFAIVSITWSVGFILGSVCGGFLYDPAHNPTMSWMHIKEDSFLGTHPAFLPSLVIALYNTIALMFAIVMLPETNANRRPIRTTKLGRFFFKFLKKDESKTTDVTVVNVNTQGSDDGEEPAKGTDGEVDDQKSLQPVPMTLPPMASKKLSYAKAMSMTPIRNITIFYMLLAGADICYAETLPLWGVASKPEGLGLLSANVAVLNLCFSIPATVANIFFHNACHFFNDDLRFWRTAVTISCVGLLLIPFATALKSQQFYFVLCWGLVRQVGISWMYSLIHLMTAKVSPRGFVGSVYAISQSFASLTRCVVPFIISPVFAWSIEPGKNRMFPFNHYLVFLIAAIPPIVSAFLTYRVQLTASEETEEFEEQADEVVIVNDLEEEERASTYLSLVASFVANPLNEGYLNVTEMERQKDEEHEKRMQEAKAKLQEEDERALDPHL